MEVNTKENNIFWHLPGFSVFFYLNQVIIHMINEHPEMFRDGYKIGSVYGTFPGAIWNGGRAVFGITSHGDMAKIIKTYNDLNVPVRFTWTNSLIEEKHLNDTYCNLIMDTADNGMNQVLVNTDILEHYLRDKYPGFKYISSTTKRLTSINEVKAELQKDIGSEDAYYLVVLDYDLNHDEKVLDELAPYADRIEILADEICFPNCPKRKAHYRDESLMQLKFEKAAPYDCPNRNKKPSFNECMKRPAFISADDVFEYRDKWGYNNFKLVGRGLPMDMVLDSYIYYLVKDKFRDEMRGKITKQLIKLGIKI
ncbi:MAG: hypothetical protein K6G12_03830 [Lachnospiraceae bacterium]|nr:hypothetical protein [Lachnospiraceae bacterium]